MSDSLSTLSLEEFPRSTAGRIVIPPALRTTSALLERQVRLRPDRPFVTLEGRTWTYREAQQRILRVAAGLASVGVKEGSRVGAMLPNCAAFVFVWLASTHLGAAVVAINPQFRGRLLDSVLGDAQCDAMVLHAVSADALTTIAAPLREGIRVVIGADEATAAQPGVTELAALESQGAGLPVPPARGDRLSLHTVSFTSGSTGPAKGVIITNNQALDSGCSYIHATGFGPEDTLYTPFAFFHGMSTRLGVVPAMIVGGHVVVAERFSASNYWKEAAECGATIGQTLPTSTAMLKAMPSGPHDRAHRITRMYNSRADEDFEGRFGVRLIEAFAMTEVGIVVYCGFPERRAGACGKAHPEWDVAVFDDQDQPVPAGEPGELVFRPKQSWLLTPGYIGRPDATVEATRNLWFHSGDIGRMDADGFIYFIDRKKERIRRRGENISSFDVESLVSSHPDVRECAALAYPAEHGEDDVRIVVVRAEGSKLAAPALYDWLTGVMPKYMLPRYIEFAQSLPRTPTNKIEKYQLKDAGLAADVWDQTRAVAANGATNSAPGLRAAAGG